MAFRGLVGYRPPGAYWHLLSLAVGWRC